MTASHVRPSFVTWFKLYLTVDILFDIHKGKMEPCVSLCRDNYYFICLGLIIKLFQIFQKCEPHPDQNRIAECFRYISCIALALRDQFGKMYTASIFLIISKGRHKYP